MIADKTYAVPNVYKTVRRLAPADRPPIQIEVPGSKSITGRALLLAALAQGATTLRGVLFSDDSRHFLRCMQDLGFEAEVNESQREQAGCYEQRAEKLAAAPDIHCDQMFAESVALYGKGKTVLLFPARYLAAQFPQGGDQRCHGPFSHLLRGIHVIDAPGYPQISGQESGRGTGAAHIETCLRLGDSASQPCDSI